MVNLSIASRKRKPVSLTSLIDVIFLLLLFFMLSSTFSKYSELEVNASKAGSGSAAEKPNIFISLEPGAWKINGSETLPEDVLGKLQNFKDDKTSKAIMQIREGVSSQTLVDALELLRQADIPVTLVN